MPLVGAYSASKFALEAAADALRMELSPWQIRVVVVEPAQTDTDMWRTADDMVAELEAGLTPEHRTLYAKHIAGFKKTIPVSQKIAVPAQKVSAVVEEALTARRPRARYVVGIGPKAMVVVDAGPSDEGPRFCAAAGVRPAVGCRRSSSATAARPQVSSRVKPQGCNGFRPLTDGVPCARVLGYDDTSLTLERLDTIGPDRAAAHEFGRRLARTHDAGADAFGAAARRMDRGRASSGHCTIRFRCR